MHVCACVIFIVRIRVQACTSVHASLPFLNMAAAEDDCALNGGYSSWKIIVKFVVLQPQQGANVFITVVRSLLKRQNWVEAYVTLIVLLVDSSGMFFGVDNEHNVYVAVAREEGVYLLNYLNIFEI